MKPLLVVNPQAGGGRTGRTFAAMRPIVERAIGEVEVVMTERRGHGVDLAREAAASGRDLVVAVGGDGTLNEVVNGVLADGPSATRVAMIAQGTGGDFRRTLGLAHRLDVYLAALARGRERRVDVGLLTYEDGEGGTSTRYFVNILSAGMGGLVDRYVAESGARVGGAAKYALASVRALAMCERGKLRCTVTSGGDADERTLRSYMIAICNGRFFGSGMQVAPMAAIDDGRFEVITMDARSKLALMLTARKLYAGEHLREDGVVHFACEKIALELTDRRARGAFLLDVDGEAMGGLPIEVEIRPKALALVA